MKKLLRLENVTFLGALIGLALGLWAPELSKQISFIGDIFLTVLKMMIIPLIFVSVFLAVAKQAGQGELGSVGWKTIAYFISSSVLACITGLTVASLMLPKTTAIGEYVKYDASKLGSISWQDVVMSFFTPNIFKSLAGGEIVQIVLFSILMGIAAISLEKSKRDLLVGVADGIHDLVMIVIKWALVIAPIGILSLVAAVIAKTDVSSLQGLGWFFAATATGVVIHTLVTLPTIGFIVGRFNPYKFIFNVREALIVALATASSSATLPVSTRVLETRENVSPKTTGFVLPIGASLNMDGSALYQALVVLFLGSIAGVDFTWTQKLLVFFFVLISSSGTAGIPGGGIVMMGTMLQMVGIPLEMIGIYLLVDRFWDPPITAVNVLGDLFGTKTIDQVIKRSHSEMLAS